MSVTPVRKRRPDKRKTYWAFQTVHAWFLCRDREKLEKSGILDGQEIAWSIPDLGEIARIASERRLTPKSDRGLGEDYFSAQRMVETKRKLESAIAAETILTSKRGLRATDVMRLWPSEKGAGVRRSVPRSEMAVQAAKIMLTESRSDHRAIERSEALKPHMDDLKYRAEYSFRTGVVKDAKAIVASDIELRESLTHIAKTADPVVAKRIERGQVKFLTKIKPVIEINALQSELDTARRVVPSWSKRGPIKKPLK